MSTRHGSSVPVYQQIANILRARIVGQSDPVATHLPTEQELAKTHGVARGTMRQGLGILAEEGLIERAPGRGTMTVPAGVRAWQRLRHSHTIAVITGTLDLLEQPATYYGQAYQGVLTASGQAGYSPVCRQVDNPFPDSDANLAPVSVNVVTGVVILHMRDEQLIAMHAATGCPVVCVDHWSTHPTTDSVVVDCFTEAHTAVEHLAAHGHRELFYVGNIVGTGEHRQPETDAIQMEAGYRRAVTLRGLNSSRDRVRFSRREHDEIAELVAWYLSLTPRPTAGVVFDEVTMKRFIEALAARGIRCPEDVSFICKTSAQDPGGVTSLCTDGFALGVKAVEVLLDQAAGRQAPGQTVAMASTLRPGNTVGHLNAVASHAHCR